MIKNGPRLTSQVCDTQVIVVRSSDSLDDLRCGGAPMVPIGGERSGELDPAFSDGTVMGKRYVDETGAEVLVTKPGAGSLSVGATALSLKEVKPLPAKQPTGIRYPLEQTGTGTVRALVAGAAEEGASAAASGSTLSIARGAGA